MFEALTNKLGGVFSRLAGKKVLTEENLSDAVREVRLALLEADVNFNVAKEFVKRVKEKVLGESVLKSVTAAQQFVKIVHDELVLLMGSSEVKLNLNKSPAVILLCGLQGSGKTTHAAKLAKFLTGKDYKKKPLLVACDLQRPAAIEQLHQLGKQAGIDVFSLPQEKAPEKVAKTAIDYAKANYYDVVIIDTAGRLHIDEALMDELKRIKAVSYPTEVLFVANAITGQDAVTMAKAFDEAVDITGTILTMLDGNARAGAAISIREVTGKPLKFEGVGEKVDDLQLFHPQSMADRILGMGDTINLVRKAQDHFDEDAAKSMEQKLRTATFTLDDYLHQMRAMKKMGPLKNLLKMLPGVSQMMPNFDEAEARATQVEAIVSSMTPLERKDKVDINMPRRKRIAKGSGTQVDDVTRVIKGFRQMQQFFKDMPANKKLFEKMMGERKS